jgi:hypothetical protein
VGQATGSEALGILTFLALSYVEPARSAFLDVAARRVPAGALPHAAGMHRLTVVAGGGARELQVDVQPRRVTLIVLRSY